MPGHKGAAVTLRIQMTERQSIPQSLWEVGWREQKQRGQFPDLVCLPTGGGGRVAFKHLGRTSCCLVSHWACLPSQQCLFLPCLSYVSQGLCFPGSWVSWILSGFYQRELWQRFADVGKARSQGLSPLSSDFRISLKVLDPLGASVSPGQTHCNSNVCQVPPGPGCQ